MNGVLATGIRSIGFELRTYLRSPDTVFFTFLFPMLMLAIFGVAFDGQGEVGERPDGSGGVLMSTIYLPGLIAAGILLSGVQNLALDISHEKHGGWLGRLGNTPLSPVSYFIGKSGMTFVTALIQMVVLIAFAVIAFDVELPTEPEKYVRLAWLFLIGIVTMSLAGIALSTLPRSAKSAGAVVLPIVLILQFISGVFLTFNMLPTWLQNIASLFPLKWLAQGMRSVFLPDHFTEMEPSGQWDVGLVAIVLGAWAIVGLVMSLITFRWSRRG